MLHGYYPVECVCETECVFGGCVGGAEQSNKTESMTNLEVRYILVDANGELMHPFISA